MADEMFIQVRVPYQTISDTLVSAFEGGSNYWYLIEGYETPGFPLRWREGGDSPMWKDSLPDGHRLYEWPLNPGGAVMISAEGVDGLHRLDLKTIEKGLTLLASKYPRHFADLVGDGGDATTGDVFLQLCLFGEVVFG